MRQDIILTEIYIDEINLRAYNIGDTEVIYTIIHLSRGDNNSVYEECTVD